MTHSILNLIYVDKHKDRFQEEKKKLKTVKDLMIYNTIIS